MRLLQAAGAEDGVLHLFDTAVLRTPGGVVTGVLFSACRSTAPSTRPPLTPNATGEDGALAAAAAADGARAEGASGDSGGAAEAQGSAAAALVGWNVGSSQQLVYASSHSGEAQRLCVPPAMPQGLCLSSAMLGCPMISDCQGVSKGRLRGLLKDTLAWRCLAGDIALLQVLRQPDRRSGSGHALPPHVPPSTHHHSQHHHGMQQYMSAPGGAGHGGRSSGSRRELPAVNVDDVAEATAEVRAQAQRVNMNRTAKSSCCGGRVWHSTR